MPKMAKLIEVERGERGFSLTVDGQEFPWFVAEAGVSTTIDRNEVPGLVLTLMAEEVHLANSLAHGGLVMAPEPEPEPEEEGARCSTACSCT